VRRIVPIAVTAAAMSFVAVAFAMGARDTLSRTRDGACKALEPDPMPAAIVDGNPPEFQLPDAGGKMVSLSAQRGHPVMLNFWATWCPPCVDEIPALEDLARRIDGTDLRLMAVSVDENWDIVRRFFAQGTRIGVLHDASKDLPKKYGTEKYPETFLIDERGLVQYRHVGAMTLEAWEREFVPRLKRGGLP
jgi:DsbE subfamily thiol:disulfide oxidoreductase